VNPSQSRDFGILRTDGYSRVVHYEEKPDSAPPGADGKLLASMGNFIFRASTLVKAVRDDAITDTSHDIAGDIVAGMYQSRKVFAYDFRGNSVPGNTEQERGYWKDVGTLDAYYGANMDLVSVTPVFSLYNSLWPIHSYSYQCPPAKFVFSDFARKRIGVATDSMVSEGAIISGGSVVRSVISPMVRVNSYSTIEESVLMEGVNIGRHCRIRKAIIDKGVHVPPNTSIGFDPEEDGRRFHISPSGVVVIPKGYGF
jgi:glucose-1-phosphate adenylyltransferase